MKKKKILINAINLYTGGSKSISHFILDEVGKLNDFKFTIIAPKILKKQISYKKRYEIIFFDYPKKNMNFFYKLFIDHVYIARKFKNENFDLLLNCGNFSSFFLSSEKQLTLFHNIFYAYNLNKIKKYLNLRLLLEIFLFKLCTKKNSYFLIQNNFVKKKLLNKFDLNKKKLFVIDTFKCIPLIYKKIKKKKISKNLKLNPDYKNIIYPANYYQNKNFDKLYYFDEIITKHKLRIKIFLTIKNIQFLKLKKIYNFKNIYNLGYLKDYQLYNFYHKFDFVLNLSDFESMCLPLYEAVFFSKKIISCKAEFIPKNIQKNALIINEINSNNIQKILIKALRTKKYKKNSFNKLSSKNMFSLNNILKTRLNEENHIN